MKKTFATEHKAYLDTLPPKYSVPARKAMVALETWPNPELVRKDLETITGLTISDEPFLGVVVILTHFGLLSPVVRVTGADGAATDYTRLEDVPQGSTQYEVLYKTLRV